MVNTPQYTKIPSTPSGRMKNPFANPTAFGMFLVEGLRTVAFYALEGQFTVEAFDAYVLLARAGLARSINAQIMTAQFPYDAANAQIVADIRRYLVMGILQENRFRVQLNMVQGWMMVLPTFVPVPVVP